MNSIHFRSCLKLKLSFAPVYLALLPTMATKLILKTTASVFRKELAEGKISMYAGKGLPRVERDATDEEIDHRREKLAEYDAQKTRLNTGKWSHKLLKTIKSDTSATLKNTEDLKTGQKKLQTSLDETSVQLVQKIDDLARSVAVGTRKIEGSQEQWIINLGTSLTVPNMNTLLTRHGLQTKGTKHQKAVTLSRLDPVLLQEFMDELASEGQPVQEAAADSGSSSSNGARGTLDHFLPKKRKSRVEAEEEGPKRRRSNARAHDEDQDAQGEEEGGELLADNVAEGTKVSFKYFAGRGAGKVHEVIFAGLFKKGQKTGKGKGTFHNDGFYAFELGSSAPKKSFSWNKTKHFKVVEAAKDKDSEKDEDEEKKMQDKKEELPDQTEGQPAEQPTEEQNGKDSKNNEEAETDDKAMHEEDEEAGAVKNQEQQEPEKTKDETDTTPTPGPIIEELPEEGEEEGAAKNQEQQEPEKTKEDANTTPTPGPVVKFSRKRLIELAKKQKQQEREETNKKEVQKQARPQQPTEEQKQKKKVQKQARPQ